MSKLLGTPTMLTLWVNPPLISRAQEEGGVDLFHPISVKDDLSTLLLLCMYNTHNFLHTHISVDNQQL